MTGARFPTLPVLLVDDEVRALQGFEIALRSGGIDHVLCCPNSEEVMPLLSRQEIEVMLLDLWMPGVSGEEILSKVAQEYPAIPVVIVTGVNEVDTAVRCIKGGAFDYLVKPIDKNRLVTTVGRAIDLRELQRENSMLKVGLLSAELKNPEAFSAIAHGSHAMRSIFQYVEAIAGTSQPVLITGETGVGKELIARVIHTVSGRKGAFIPVNAAGLDDNIFADTLFGHRKGAFTGADETRDGLIGQAAGGTLFLDEIGDLSSISQIKLLRLVQEREYFPLGSDVLKRTDTRIIVATNQDIQALLQSGKLRKDLYYRLYTHHVHVPSLRERMEDLPVLVDHFLEETSAALGKKKPTPPKELFALLRSYPFPGNVRELKSMIIDAVSSHRRGVLSLECFRKAIGHQEPITPAAADLFSQGRESPLAFSEKLPTIRQAERWLIAEAMRRAGGNQAIAARMLGITRQALNRRLRRAER
jgi:DNA-binding NtrC family response regulator